VRLGGVFWGERNREEISYGRHSHASAEGHPVHKAKTWSDLVFYGRGLLKGDEIHLSAVLWGFMSCRGHTIRAVGEPEFFTDSGGIVTVWGVSRSVLLGLAPFIGPVGKRGARLYSRH